MIVLILQLFVLRNYCNKEHTTFNNSSKNWVNEWRKCWVSLLLTHSWILATLTWSRRLKKINNAAYRGIWIIEGLWFAKHLIFSHHQKQCSLAYLQFYKNQQEWVGGLIFNLTLVGLQLWQHWTQQDVWLGTLLIQNFQVGWCHSPLQSGCTGHTCE